MGKPCPGLHARFQHGDECGDRRLAGQLPSCATTTKHVKKKTGHVAHAGLLLGEVQRGDQSVTLTLLGKQAFATGGEITVNYSPPTGVSDADVPLDSDDATFTIAKKAVTGITAARFEPTPRDRTSRGFVPRSMPGWRPPCPDFIVLASRKPTVVAPKRRYVGRASRRTHAPLARRRTSHPGVRDWSDSFTISSSRSDRRKLPPLMAGSRHPGPGTIRRRSPACRTGPGRSAGGSRQGQADPRCSPDTGHTAPGVRVESAVITAGDRTGTAGVFPFRLGGQAIAGALQHVRRDPHPFRVRPGLVGAVAPLVLGYAFLLAQPVAIGGGRIPVGRDPRPVRERRCTS